MDRHILGLEIERMKSYLFKFLRCVLLAVIALVVFWAYMSRYAVRSPVAPSNACIANLKQIAGAIEQWALEHHRNPEEVVAITDISGSESPYLKRLINRDLKCPAGGIYKLGRVGELPTCTLPGHSM